MRRNEADWMLDKILFACQLCGEMLEVPGAAAGARAVCPACNGLTPVPEAAGSPSAQPAAPAAGQDGGTPEPLELAAGEPGTPAPPVAGRVCPTCGAALPPAPTDVERVAKCVGCGTVVAPDGSVVAEDLEYGERSDRAASLAGWAISLVLHAMLFLTFAGAKWLWVPGEGTGEGEAEVGVVFDEGGDTIKSVDPGPLAVEAAAHAPEIEVQPPQVDPMPPSGPRTGAIDIEAPVSLDAVPAATGPPAATVPDSAAAGEIASDPFAQLAVSQSAGAFMGPYQNRGGLRKRRALARHGGRGTESAVAKGLAWLASNQKADGSWGQPATTGLALLAFLGDGHTTRAGKYKQVVSRGFEWLIGRGKREGECLVFVAPRQMYHQGIATFALAEEAAMSRNPTIKEAARAAAQTIVQAQYRDGGWRYTRTGYRGDTSVVGWQVMALKAAKNARLYDPRAAFAGAQRFLDSVKSEGAEVAGFGYQSPSATWRLSSVGLVCLQFMSTEDLRLMRKVANRVVQQIPAPNRQPPEIYGLYYATIGIFQMGGSYWERWNEPMKQALMSSQRSDGRWRGYQYARRSSFPDVYSTALSVLTLEVYYRYSPLYGSR